MKRKITMIILCIGLNTIAQIKFEKGYFISNKGIKTECLIKNEGWYNNPTEFKYKLTKTSETSISNLISVNEFSIYGKITYKKFNVLIDKSSLKYNSLSKHRTSKFVTETLFLKLLVNGDAELYQYRNGELLRFFVKKDTIFEQLEYKKYLKNSGGIGENTNYIQQLIKLFPCDKINPKKVNYKTNNLVDYFTTYNVCKNNKIETANYTNHKSKTKFNISGKISIGSSSMEMKNNRYINSSILDFKFSKMTYRLGVELELVLSSNKQKWSAFIEPTFQSFASSINNLQKYARTLHVNYKSIEIPIGIRHYFYLNDKNKLFLNFGPVIDFPINSSVVHSELLNSSKKPELDLTLNLAMFTGIGYDINNKFRIEVRYFLEKNIPFNDNSNYWKMKYNNAHLGLSYNFF